MGEAVTEPAHTGEAVGGTALGLAPTIAVNVLGLDSTLRLIPDTVAITRAMTLIGATLGLVLGHHIRGQRTSTGRILWAVTSGITSVGLWIFNNWFVRWATVAGWTEGWTVILSAILVFSMMTTWSTLATLAGVVATNPTGK